MARIDNPNEFVVLIKRADELQKRLDRLTGGGSDDYAEVCRKADALIESAPLVPNDGAFRMVPDETLWSTQQRNLQLEGRQRRLERKIKAAESQVRSEINAAKKAELAAAINEAKEALSSVVREKVSARTINLSELIELQQRCRRDLNEAIKAGDKAAQADIRAKMVELSRDRRRRGAFRVAM